LQFSAASAYDSGVIDFQDVLAIHNRVRELREPELVLLNGHLLIERLLIGTVAARLRCPEENVQR